MFYKIHFRYPNFVISDIASTSFEDERIGGTLGCNVELGIFNREKLRVEHSHGGVNYLLLVFVEFLV